MNPLVAKTVVNFKLTRKWRWCITIKLKRLKHLVLGVCVTH
ncbi:hypothetical protein DOT_0835 [Desulfosporosinus sp. OT]|nr:hypothetical protein DOT_0835 [Desulfosporosinus sp. OT]